MSGYDSHDGGGDDAPDHVGRYLRRLSRWVPRACRDELVMEAARHLYDATRRAEGEGLPRAMAQQAAIRAFGPAWRIGLAARGLADHPLLDALDRVARTFDRRGWGLWPRRPAHRGSIRLGRRPRLF